LHDGPPFPAGRFVSGARLKVHYARAALFDAEAKVKLRSAAFDHGRLSARLRCNGEDTAMRAAGFALLACLVLGGAAAAQDRGLSSPPFYIDRDAHFAILFPASPSVTDIRYMTAGGKPYPAKRYSLEQGTNRYSVTVVDFSAGPAVDAAVVQKAVDDLKARGKLIYEAAAEYEPGVGSRQLMVSLPDGRQIQGSVYMWDHRLWITEGIGAPGTPALLRFAQSMTLLQADGNEVNNEAGRNEAASGPTR
jgi:hypothetical protein